MAQWNVAYHGVHGEVVVLRLQLRSMLVTATDLRVALEEHFLVVADPVKHLHKQHTEDIHSSLYGLQTHFLQEHPCCYSCVHSERGAACQWS